MKKKIIIVTGGAGFVGSNLIEFLIQNTKFDIISIDNYSTGTKRNHIKNSRVKYLRGNTSRISNIIKTTDFNHLKKKEQEGLFEENVFTKSSNQKINFFHQGPKNSWKSKLESEIVDEINLKFKDEMIQLGYL